MNPKETAQFCTEFNISSDNIYDLEKLLEAAKYAEIYYISEEKVINTIHKIKRDVWINAIKYYFYKNKLYKINFSQYQYYLERFLMFKNYES